jgi:hypothetical protein
LVEQARHWLHDYTMALALFNAASNNYALGGLDRNVLDDLRLALELLLKAVLGNNRPLEKQLEPLGQHLKAAGMSSLLSGMLRTLLNYYAQYQNEFVKHADAVRAVEVELIFELTAAFMKHVVRVSHPDA